MSFHWSLVIGHWSLVNRDAYGGKLRTSPPTPPALDKHDRTS
ncbi:MAG: hypothetical protein PUP90_02350 [Nostoc sp. S4]|nr:hypothetical protein [Nostoc sp. S4]